MDECREPKYEDMLHAFELGMLSDNDREKLQIHLLGCDHCFDKARDFEDATILLRDDPDVKQTIDQIDKKKQPSKPARLKILNLLWPEKARFIPAKPLIMIILLMMVSYPIYRFGFDQQSDYTQTINLFPLRGGKQKIVSLKRGGEVIVNFVYENVKPGKFYQIELKSRDGDVIYSDDKFSNFNTSGLGSITFPSSEFEKGGYILSIVDPKSDKRDSISTYYFQVE